MAIANMVLGLKELHIRGEIRTNVDYTVDILHVSASEKLVKQCDLQDSCNAVSHIRYCCLR